jgi:hypothetical protein
MLNPNASLLLRKMTIPLLMTITKFFSRHYWKLSFSFIVAFIVLLSFSAFFLASGVSSLSHWAENTAVCAYFALATGVILQIIFLGKKKTMDPSL